MNFATGNPHKFREAKDFLSKYSIDVRVVKVKGTEIQDRDLRRIALHSLSEASPKVEKPIMVEDAGLFVRALRGFPGPYSSFAFDTIGLDGILKLLKGDEDRYAEFRSCVAMMDAEGETKAFLGISRGRIAVKAEGDAGFGFDPIFIPQGSDRTFGQMEPQEKSIYSHRARALGKLARSMLGKRSCTA